MLTKKTAFFINIRVFLFAGAVAAVIGYGFFIFINHFDTGDREKPYAYASTDTCPTASISSSGSYNNDSIQFTLNGSDPDTAPNELDEYSMTITVNGFPWSNPSGSLDGNVDSAMEDTGTWGIGTTICATGEVKDGGTPVCSDSDGPECVTIANRSPSATISDVTSNSILTLDDIGFNRIATFTFSVSDSDGCGTISSWSFKDNLGNTYATGNSCTTNQIENIPMLSAWEGTNVTFTLSVSDTSFGTDSTSRTLAVKNTTPDLLSFTSNPADGTTIFFGGPTTLSFSFSASDENGNWSGGAGDWVIRTSVNAVLIPALTRSGSFPAGNQGNVSDNSSIVIDDTYIDNPTDAVQSCITITDTSGSTDGSCVNFNAVCPVRKVTTAAIWDQPASDVVVNPNDLWGACDNSVGQQYRTIRLRQSDCHFKEVPAGSGFVNITEMRSCAQTPFIADPIYRDDPAPPNDYSDVDINPGNPPPPLIDEISFGPLESIVRINGNYLYPVQAVGDFLKRRTHLEVWAGVVKIGGTDLFSAPDVPFIENPTCVGTGTNCTLRAQILNTTPECTDAIEVRSYVKPYIFYPDGFGGWDDGESDPPSQLSSSRVFVVVPSIWDGGLGYYRGAEFSFWRANQAVDNSFVHFLAANPQNEAPVGLPLTMQMEAGYSLQAHACDLGGIPINCGFGLATTANVGFFNNPGAPGTKRDIVRAEKYVDFAEVGKPWTNYRIFALVPFLNQNMNFPGNEARIRSHVCGGDIGFIQSDMDFKLLQEPFGLHQIVPRYGDNVSSFPAVLGYNLFDFNLVNAALIAPTLGGNAVSFLPGSESYRYFTLPGDVVMPQYTNLEPLQVCRNGFCSRLDQSVFKQAFNPSGLLLPDIKSVTSLQNWQAEPIPIDEDIPYREHYCVDEVVHISGNGFGAVQGAQTIGLWAPDGPNLGWNTLPPPSYLSWSDNEIIVQIPNISSGLQSVDCPRNNTNMDSAGQLSDLTLPLRFCNGGVCRYLDQTVMRTPPPARSRLVSDFFKSPNYCIGDQITITGTDFGEERLGAEAKINFLPVAQYLYWSDTKIVVTPSSSLAMFNTQRSPRCPRHKPADGLLSDAVAFGIGDFSMTCPDLPSGPRACAITNVNVISGSDQLYAYSRPQAVVPDVCADEEIVFFPPIPPNPSPLRSVSIFSPETGWREARQITQWQPGGVGFYPPEELSYRKSGSCPAGNKEVTVFTGPIRMCNDVTCAFVPLSVTSAAGGRVLYNKVQFNKQYLFGESVVIKGENFRDIRSDDEFIQAGLPGNDRRNTGHVEFYTDEFGFLPAKSYLSWTDTEIIATPPEVTLTTAGGGMISVGQQPIRVCTRNACVSNVSGVRYNQSPGSTEAFPEGLTFSPACLPVNKEGHISIYGHGLNAVADAYMILDNAAATIINTPIYFDPALGFLQKYDDKIVIKVPANSVILPAVPEEQVVTAKIYLDLPLLPDQQLGPRVTFSNFCNQTVSCVAAPAIVGTPGSGYAGGPPITLQGCNFGDLGTGSAFVFNDVMVPFETSDAIWTKNQITVSPPQGASSGGIGVNVWTGLIGIPAIWDAFSTSSGGGAIATSLPPSQFVFLPSLSEVSPRVGVAGQIIDMYGSGFCYKNMCTVPLGDVRFGVWQRIASLNPEIPGVSAQVVEVNPERIRVIVPGNARFIETSGDVIRDKSKLGVSGQIQIFDFDGVLSRPFTKVTTFDPLAAP